MRVLFINSVCGKGSTGRICTDIADRLGELGHESFFAYGRGEAPKKYRENAFRVGTDSGVMLRGGLARVFDNSGFTGRAATNALIDHIEKLDPDIIHLHNLHGYYLDVERFFVWLKASGKPVVWTLHDCWPFTGHCAHFDFCGCDRWKTECFSCPEKKSYPASLLLDRSRSNRERKKAAFCGVGDLTVVSPSRWLDGLVRESFLSEYESLLIPNGINTDVFKPTASDFSERMGLGDRRIVLGVASVWNRRKGFEDMAELTSMLGDGYAVVIVGVTPEQKKRLPENITAITGTDSISELAEIYSAAHVFVNPTYEDNYPTVNLEALSCGTPVITYATGGSPESADASCVVPRGRIDLLAEKIRREDAVLPHGLDTDRVSMANKYISLYKKKLGVL